MNDRPTLPFDDDVKLGYVHLIWGMTHRNRLDLVAIATDDDAVKRYVISGQKMGRYSSIHVEKAFVNHLFGGGMLALVERRDEKIAQAIRDVGKSCSDSTSLNDAFRRISDKITKG